MISSKARIGKNCKIADTAIIHDKVVIGDNVVIEDFCVIGYDNLTRVHDETRVFSELTIGDNCLIRTGSTLYKGSKLAAEVKIGHGVLLREGCAIGPRSVIGNGVFAEGYLRVGKCTHIHAQSHLTAFMDIGDYVFFGPNVVTMNDPAAAHYRPWIEREVKGPTIGRGARIGSAVRLLPSVLIGEEAFIGAGSVVTKNIPAREIWTGVPARKVADVNPSEFLRIEEEE